MTENIANLIRLAADGEITAEQQAMLDAHLDAQPEVRQAVEFQRQLRVAVGRVMGGSHVTAPTGLEQQIRKSLVAEERAVAEREEGPFSFIRTIGRRRVPTSIAAGFLLLLGAAVIMSIFNLPSGTSNYGPKSGLPVASGLDFPSIEHVKCASNRSYAEQKLVLHSIDEVKAHFVDELKWAVPVPDLSSAGFAFVDAGPCTLNDRSVESVHLRYSDGDVIVSVWVERVPRSDLTHMAQLEDGHAYEVRPSQSDPDAEASVSYYAWRDGEFVYRFVPATVKNARALAITIGMPDVAPEVFK